MNGVAVDRSLGWKSDISNRCTIILRVYGVNVDTNKALGVTTERADAQISDSNGKEFGKY
jgi:hypothetical protein